MRRRLEDRAKEFAREEVGVIRLPLPLPPTEETYEQYKRLSDLKRCEVSYIQGALDERKALKDLVKRRKGRSIEEIMEELWGL